MARTLVSYLRVSGGRGQRADGLGIEAQRQAVKDHCATTGSQVLREIVEVESGRRNDRPQLAEALAHARVTNSVLCVARLDRLSRDAAFLFELERSGVEIVACDMPTANRLTVRLMAVLAQEEAERISARTKAALAAAKLRGTTLGGWRGGAKVDGAMGRAALSTTADAYARDAGPVAARLRAGGASLGQIASHMAMEGIRTARGGSGWTATAVRRLLARHDALQAAV